MTEITPDELIDNPTGRVPPSVNVKESAASKSLKKALRSRDAIVVASTPDWGEMVPCAVGASLVPVTVTVTVAVSI